MRRVALLIPISSENRILLQHRDAEAPIKPNLWAFFGGHVEPDETPRDAVIREIREELLLAIQYPRFFKTFIYDGEKWGRVERNIFTVRLDHSIIQLKRQLQEGDDVIYASRADLETLDMTDNDRAIAYAVFDNLHKL